MPDVMLETLPLPSGFVARVARPSVRALLSGASLAETTLATAGLSADTLLEEDRFALEMWAADAIAEDPEAPAFARICVAFGCRPSRELGVKDGLVAFCLDNAMVDAIPTGGRK